MKVLTRTALILLVGLFFISPALARKPSPQPVVIVPGIYERFTVGKGSGDLEGMRVVIVSAGGGYHAIVQIAQGGAEDPKPEFVPVEVTRRSVSFSVGDKKFTGTVSATGLTLKSTASETQVLKRVSCSNYFR